MYKVKFTRLFSSCRMIIINPCKISLDRITFPHPFYSAAPPLVCLALYPAFSLSQGFSAFTLMTFWLDNSLWALLQYLWRSHTFHCHIISLLLKYWLASSFKNQRPTFLACAVFPFPLISGWIWPLGIPGRRLEWGRKMRLKYLFSLFLSSFWLFLSTRGPCFMEFYFSRFPVTSPCSCPSGSRCRNRFYW